MAGIRKEKEENKGLSSNGEISSWSDLDLRQDETVLDPSTWRLKLRLDHKV